MDATVSMILLLGLLSCTCLAAPTVLQDLLELQNNAAYAMKSSHNLPLLSTFNESLRSEGVFIGSESLEMSQFGNRISRYFESWICSDIVGVHFINRAKIAGDEHAIKFLRTFPQIRLHPNPTHQAQYALSYTWNQTCPQVSTFPHEYQGAWSQRPLVIAEFMHTAIKAVHDDVRNVSVPAESFAYIMPKEHSATMLPLVPSAVIMFRCVDILHFNHRDPYGFLNFNAYMDLIPSDATHIYVLSEGLSYLGFPSTAQRHCKDISEFLVEFLHIHYPKATVALRRGHPIDSIAMMSNTEILVSAPSTFSLFPAIANPNRVYLMPATLLREQPFLRDNFLWLMSPIMISPGDSVKMKDKNALAKYKALFTAPLSKPVGFTSHTV